MSRLVRFVMALRYKLKSYIKLEINKQSLREYTSTFHKKFGRAKITASLLNLGGSLLLQGWHLTYVQLWRKVSPFVVTLKKKLRNLLKIRFDGISRCRMYNQQSHIESFSITWKNHLPEKLHATNSDWGKPAVLCFLVSILLEFKKQDKDERVG